MVVNLVACGTMEGVTTPAERNDPPASSPGQDAQASTALTLRTQLVRFILAGGVSAVVDYSLMVVARDTRDYAWVFSRSKQVSVDDLEHARQQLRGWGYNVDKWRRVPHTATLTAND